MANHTHYDVLVAGAGVFGAWTALHLAKRGARVLLADMHGPGNSYSSSGGETRIIRMGYGPDEIYTRWAQRSLVQWKRLFAEESQPLFYETGVLWLAGASQDRIRATRATLTACGVPFEWLTPDELAAHYPQISFEGVSSGLLEPRSGVLLARRAVAATVAGAQRLGAEYACLRVAGISGNDKQSEAAFAYSESGERLYADKFVFACGAWLATLFPGVLGKRIFPTRQEVFFFGVPAGNPQFSAPQTPTWLFQDDEIYGMPEIEHRGLKAALDHHGEAIDPETLDRKPTEASVQKMRAYVGKRFPALRGAPLLETRVCQYENTSSGDFLIDRHPEFSNVWFAGGGSGHGFKHGPAAGEYLAGRLAGELEDEPRFSLASKKTAQHRAIF
jgi:monomeric sarcosine oxidase